MKSRTIVMSTNDNIDVFISAVRSELQGIRRLRSPFRKRVLYFALLDTLSICAFPRVTGNRVRLVRLIDKHADWPDKDRVSLLQLRLLASVTRSGASATLLQYLNQGPG